MAPAGAELTTPRPPSITVAAATHPSFVNILLSSGTRCVSAPDHRKKIQTVQVVPATWVAITHADGLLNFHAPSWFTQ